MRETDYLTLGEFFDMVKDLPRWYQIRVGDFGRLTKDAVSISRKNSSVSLEVDVDETGLCEGCDRQDCTECDRVDPFDCDGDDCTVVEELQRELAEANQKLETIRKVSGEL